MKTLQKSIISKYEIKAAKAGCVTKRWIFNDRSHDSQSADGNHPEKQKTIQDKEETCQNIKKRVGLELSRSRIEYIKPESTQAGEGNGNPHQYSCLENPMDGGAWQAAVHGVSKSRTQLSDFNFTFHSHALENMRKNGNPLQCSWLENPRNGEAWWAAVYGVAESDMTEVTQQHNITT